MPGLSWSSLNKNGRINKGLHLTRHGQTMTETDWTDCHFIRPVGSHSCVIRLQETGAILQLRLKEALDIAQACLVCPTKSIPARVKLPLDLDAGHSELDVTWPGPAHAMLVMPPPERFISRTATLPRKTKLQKRS